MKKTVMRLSTALSLVLLAGCGSSSSSSSPSDIGLKALSQNSIEVKEDTKEEVSVTLQTLDKKSSIQEGVNFTIAKGVKKGEIIGKVKSDKFDGEIINMWLCGECSYLFSIDEAGNLVANCDIDDEFDGATMTLKATVKKDGQCCEVEDEISVKTDITEPKVNDGIYLISTHYTGGRFSSSECVSDISLEIEIRGNDIYDTSNGQIIDGNLKLKNDLIYGTLKDGSIWEGNIDENKHIYGEYNYKNAGCVGTFSGDMQL